MAIHDPLEQAVKMLEDEIPKKKPTKSQKGLSDDELVNLVLGFKSASENKDFDELVRQRAEANLAYAHNDKELFPPTTNMSSVMMNLMTPAVDTLTTYMTRTFCADKEVIKFSPTNMEASDAAKQAEMMVNHVIFKENNGYDIFNRAFKDAAINHNAILKVTWISEPVAYEEDYVDMTKEMMDAVVAQRESEGYECEIVKEKTVTSTEIIQAPDPATGGMIEIEQTSETIDFTLRCTMEKGRPVIENVPPEEFVINSGATAINDSHLTAYVGQQSSANR